MQSAEDVIAGLFDSRHQWRRRRRRRCRPIWFRPKTPTPIRRHFNWKSPQRQIQSWRWTRLCERGGQPMPTPGLAIDAARRKSLSRPRGFYSAAKWRSRVSSRRPYFGGTRVGSELVIGNYRISPISGTSTYLCPCLLLSLVSCLRTSIYACPRYLKSRRDYCGMSSKHECGICG